MSIPVHMAAGKGRQKIISSFLPLRVPFSQTMKSDRGLRACVVQQRKSRETKEILSLFGKITAWRGTLTEQYDTYVREREKKKIKRWIQRKSKRVRVKDLVLVTLGCAMHYLFYVKYPDTQHARPDNQETQLRHFLCTGVSICVHDRQYLHLDGFFGQWGVSHQTVSKSKMCLFFWHIWPNNAGPLLHKVGQRKMRVCARVLYDQTQMRCRVPANQLERWELEPFSLPTAILAGEGEADREKEKQKQREEGKNRSETSQCPAGSLKLSIISFFHPLSAVAMCHLHDTHTHIECTSLPWSVFMQSSPLLLIVFHSGFLHFKRF